MVLSVFRENKWDRNGDPLNFPESGWWGRILPAMKVHQKWNIAAQVGLAVSIVLAIFATWMLMTYIVPKVIFFHQEKGAVIPPYFQMPVNVCEITTRYWYLWTPILFSAVGWFEWKCTSQNKGDIRTFILVGLSLVSNAFVLWLALTIATATSIFLHLFFPSID